MMGVVVISNQLPVVPQPKHVMRDRNRWEYDLTNHITQGFFMSDRLEVGLSDSA